jgi:hypothetical protein
MCGGGVAFPLLLFPLENEMALSESRYDVEIDGLHFAIAISIGLVVDEK